MVGNYYYVKSFWILSMGLLEKIKIQGKIHKQYIYIYIIGWDDKCSHKLNNQTAMISLVKRIL